MALSIRRAPPLFPRGPAAIDWSDSINRALKEWWPFNEGGGQRLYNLTGRATDTGRHAVLNNSSWSQGHHGPAVLFSGSSSDYATTQSATLSTATDTKAPWTISFWARVVNTSHYGMIITLGSASGNWCIFVAATNASQFQLKTLWEGEKNVTSGTISANRWYHVAARNTGAVVELFVNGVSQGTTAVGTNTSRSGVYKAFGNLQAGDSFWFGGSAQDFRIWTRSLSQTEIRSLYTSPTRGLVPYRRRSSRGPTGSAYSARILSSQGMGGGATAAILRGVRANGAAGHLAGGRAAATRTVAGIGAQGIKAGGGSAAMRGAAHGAVQGHAALSGASMVRVTHGIGTVGDIGQAGASIFTGVSTAILSATGHSGAAGAIVGRAAGAMAVDGHTGPAGAGLARVVAIICATGDAATAGASTALAAAVAALAAAGHAGIAGAGVSRSSRSAAAQGHVGAAGGSTIRVVTAISSTGGAAQSAISTFHGVATTVLVATGHAGSAAAAISRGTGMVASIGTSSAAAARALRAAGFIVAVGHGTQSAFQVRRAIAAAAAQGQGAQAQGAIRRAVAALVADGAAVMLALRTGLPGNGLRRVNAKVSKRLATGQGSTRRLSAKASTRYLAAPRDD